MTRPHPGPVNLDDTVSDNDQVYIKLDFCLPCVDIPHLNAWIFISIYFTRILVVPPCLKKMKQSETIQCAVWLS